MPEENTAIEKSDAALAASAHSRVNVPLNLDNWKTLPKETQEELTWSHQHILDDRLSWEDASDAVGYDKSTVYRWLKGTYEGSWPNAMAAIKSYRKVCETRGTIQVAEIVRNSIVRLVHAALDYAVANNSITTIIGESRMGKSVAALLWRDENNHGRSVYVVAPPCGGTKMFLRRIADAVGVNKNMAAPAMYEAIARAFNKHRILIVDEAARLLPNDRRTNPTNLEILRDLYNDGKGCSLALIATQRFSDELQKSSYMFEQILGRIGMPMRLPRRIKDSDIRPIVSQYVKNPSPKLMQTASAIANSLGRLGTLVEILKATSRNANQKQQTMTEEHVFMAIALRRQMMGDV